MAAHCAGRDWVRRMIRDALFAAALGAAGAVFLFYWLSN
jgi:hypothetical protein